MRRGFPIAFPSKISNAFGDILSYEKTGQEGILMPWIKIIPEHEAQGELKEVYAKIREQRQGEKINRDRDASAGGPPISPPMLHSLNPKAMWHTAELMWEIMRGESRLTTAQREMIATVTSAALNCRF
jgi:Carboxymuconolactone decarboxylase family